MVFDQSDIYKSWFVVQYDLALLVSNPSKPFFLLNHRSILKLFSHDQMKLQLAVHVCLEKQHGIRL